MSIKSTDDSDKAKKGSSNANTESNGGTAPRSFDNYGEFLAYIQAHGASEVFVSVTTNPPVIRDPRADVYHATVQARIMEPVTVKVRGKEKIVKEPRVVTYCAALDLLVVDQIAQQDEFDAMTDKALAAIVASAELIGMRVRRGRL